MFTGIIRKLGLHRDISSVTQVADTINATTSSAVKDIPQKDGSRTDWAQKIDREFLRIALDLPDNGENKLNSVERDVLRKIDEQLLEDPDFQKQLPRMPKVIPQIMLLLRNESTSAEDIARQLSQDLALAGELIRLSNSAFYTRGRVLNSLEEAIVSIGFTGLRQMLISVVMKPIMGQENNRVSLWDLGIRTAMLSDTVAYQVGLNRFHAYIAGMLSQAGNAIAAHELKDCLLIKQSHASNAFIDAVHLRTCRLSYLAGKHWEFPDTVMQITREMRSSYEPASMSQLAQMIWYAEKTMKLSILHSIRDDIEDTMPDVTNQFALAIAQSLRMFDNKSRWKS